nr:hypothetical protein [uncultured Methanoregula sp.]
MSITSIFGSGTGTIYRQYRNITAALGSHLCRSMRGCRVQLLRSTELRMPARSFLDVERTAGDHLSPR